MPMKEQFHGRKGENDMPKLENWYFITGVNKNNKKVYGEVYGHTSFEDGDFITTSLLVEVNDKYVKTKSGTIYELGKKLELSYTEKETRYMILRRGADAIHQLGNIKREVFDAELIIIDEEFDDYYVGRFAEGFGYLGIKFKKEDCRALSEHEADLCDRGRMYDIKF